VSSVTTVPAGFTDRMSAAPTVKTAWPPLPLENTMPTQCGITPGRLTPKDSFITKIHLSWNRAVCPGIHGVNNLVNKTVAPVRTVSGVQRGPGLTGLALCGQALGS
jgi:hypothetical protein